MTLYRLAHDVLEGRAFSILSVQQSKEVDCPTLKMEVASLTKRLQLLAVCMVSHNQAGLTLQSGGAS